MWATRVEPNQGAKELNFARTCLAYDTDGLLTRDEPMMFGKQITQDHNYSI